MHSLNIAVIGSGISGLSAAWLLSKRHRVTLFEAEDRLGGHTNTVDMDIDGTNVPVDTGFICYNHISYPNLIALFDHLDIATHDTSMSFSASLASGAYEYSGGTYTGMVAQPVNVFKPSHWRMIADILRFFREAPKALDTLDADTTLAEYLANEGYSSEFADRHLLPMAAAIWSSSTRDITRHPARAFIRFFQNHGLLQVDGRPKWGTVNGGARSYIDAMLADGDIDVQTGNGIERVVRGPEGVVLHSADGVARPFDQVVIASHADQALAMLDAPSSEESRLLGAFSYSKNRAVLHRDRRFMPKRRLSWASWNYLDYRRKLGKGAAPDELTCLTYWMNSLQNLPTKRDVFLTLNPPARMEMDNVSAEFSYMHPIFDSAALNAQEQLWSLQGVNRTWFCGAHFGHGFHEDGLQTGLAVAEQLGGVRRPWDVAQESGRITLAIPETLPQAAE